MMILIIIRCCFLLIFGCKQHLIFSTFSLGCYLRELKSIFLVQQNSTIVLFFWHIGFVDVYILVEKPTCFHSQNPDQRSFLTFKISGKMLLFAFLGLIWCYFMFQRHTSQIYPYSQYLCLFVVLSCISNYIKVSSTNDSLLASS